MRALLAEAEKIDISGEPFPEGIGPLREGDTIIGPVPPDIQQMILFSETKLKRQEEALQAFDEADDPDGAKWAEICLLELEADMIDSCALDSLRALYMRQVNCLGSIGVRQGWVVIWTPEEEEDGGEGESAVRRKLIHNA